MDWIRQRNAGSGRGNQTPQAVSSKAANDQHIAPATKFNVDRWGPVPLKASYEDLAQRLKKRTTHDTERNAKASSDPSQRKNKAVIVEVDIKKFVASRPRDRADPKPSSTISVTSNRNDAEMDKADVDV